MTKSALLAFLALCSIWAIAGCGTVENLRGTDEDIKTGRPFGGVRYDVEAAVTMLEDTSGGHGGLLGRSLQLVLGPYLLLVDLPLSAVADTLTLPLVYHKAPAQGANRSSNPLGAVEQQQ
jgi:uncharacterized protein YceK